MSIDFCWRNCREALGSNCASELCFFLSFPNRDAVCPSSSASLLFFLLALSFLLPSASSAVAPVSCYLRHGRLWKHSSWFPASAPAEVVFVSLVFISKTAVLNNLHLILRGQEGKEGLLGSVERQDTTQCGIFLIRDHYWVYSESLSRTSTTAALILTLTIFRQRTKRWSLLLLCCSVQYWTSLTCLTPQRGLIWSSSGSKHTELCTI